MKELWRSVHDHPAYEVSTFGNVRTWKVPGPDQTLRSRTPKPVAQFMDRKSAKLYVFVYYGNAKRQYLVGALVLEAFARARPAPKTRVIHLDGNPNNCRLDNLVWSEDIRAEHDKLDIKNVSRRAKLTERLQQPTKGPQPSSRRA